MAKYTTILKPNKIYQITGTYHEEQYDCIVKTQNTNNYLIILYSSIAFEQNYIGEEVGWDWELSEWSNYWKVKALELDSVIWRLLYG